MKQPLSPAPRSAPARLIIADDHDLARAGLRSMLESDRGLKLVGEANNGREAVALCQDLKPDLALLDVRMPDMDGLEATRVIRQVAPDTRVLIVTTHENPDYLLAALKAGAAGYLLNTGEGNWTDTVVCQVLHAGYIDHAHQHGDRHPLTIARLGIRLRELSPRGFKISRPHEPWNGIDRPNRYSLLDLKAHRASFLAAMQIDPTSYEWPEDPDHAV